MLNTLVLAWFVLVYFTVGIVINVLQLCILPLYWVNSHLYQVIVNQLAYGIFSMISFLGDWWGGTKLYLYGRSEDIHMVANEKSLTIINHYGDVDWLTSWVFAERLGFLERTNAFIKDIVKYVPTMGWCWWFCGWGFLKRDWKKDQNQMEKHINACKENKTNYSITLFCEGTRRTEEKLKASQEFAIKAGKTPLKYHLYPRTKGFAVVVNKLRDHFSSIYDAEIAFPEPEKATVLSLLNRNTVEVHIHLRRIPMSEVKCETEEDASEFCVDLYKQKDELMDYFETNKCFPGERVDLPRTKTNLITFIFHNVWVSVLYLTLLRYCVELHGSMSVLIICSIIAGITYVLLNVLVRFTVTKKGSSFGLRKGEKIIRENNNETIHEKTE